MDPSQTQLLPFFFLLLFLLSPPSSSSPLSPFFYSLSCPNLELFMRDSIRSSSADDASLPGKLLRLVFHDCIVEVGGPSVKVPLGRRDGRVSLESNVRPNMVDTSFSLDEMAHLFSSKGLDMDDLVTLSGAHTIGLAHCSAFSERFEADSKGNVVPIDANLEENYAMELIKKCPVNANLTVTVSDDPVTPRLFDNQYYINVLNKKGLFLSDSVLSLDARTRKKVEAFGRSQDEFFTSWAASFIKLTNIGVKTGDEGEIRSSCSSING